MIGQGRAEGEIGWRRTEWVGGSNYVKTSCQSLVRGTCAAARGFEFAAGLLRVRIFPGYEATYSLLVSLTAPSPKLSPGPSTSRISQAHPPQRGSPRVPSEFPSFFVLAVPSGDIDAEDRS